MRPLVPIVAFALLHAFTARGAEESCVTCHANVKTEFQPSVHARTFSCTSCHGGDPSLTSTAAHATDKGYRGAPARLEIPALCASCHADAERMRGSGLPIDQYTQYQQSGHGRTIASGDARAAVCTDCHGTHRILSRLEPNSPVSRENVEATCSRCHDNAELMQAFNLPAGQGAQLRASVHGKALFVDEHPSAPTCATCHGAHSAKAGGATAACGQCHARTLELLQEGPHAAPVRAGTMNSCVSCHGAHEVAPPDDNLFDTACVRCHQPGTPAFGVGQQLKTLLTQATASISTATAEVEALQKTWPSVARKRSRVAQAHAYLVEAQPVQHSLDVHRVDDLTRSARSLGEDVRATVHGAQQEGNLRYVALALLWLYLLFLAGVTYAYGRERARRGTDR